MWIVTKGEDYDYDHMLEIREVILIGRFFS